MAQRVVCSVCGMRPCACALETWLNDAPLDHIDHALDATEAFFAAAGEPAPPLLDSVVFNVTDDPYWDDSDEEP